MTSRTFATDDGALLDALTSVYADRALRDAKREAIAGTTLGRVKATLPLLPDARGDQCLLDLGFGDYWVGLYRQLGFSRFKGVTMAPPKEGGQVSPLDKLDLAGIESEVVFADVDSQALPISDETIDVACSFEILEHLATDPMRMIAEANRVLKPGGVLVLTTPNIACSRSFQRLLRGQNPNNWSVYSPDPVASAYRHKREYTPGEVRQLFSAGGFLVESLHTVDIHRRRLRDGAFHAAAVPLFWITRRGRSEARGHIVAMGSKAGPVADRYPSWLYADFGFGGEG